MKYKCRALKGPACMQDGIHQYSLSSGESVSLVFAEHTVVVDKSMLDALNLHYPGVFEVVEKIMPVRSPAVSRVAEEGLGLDEVDDGSSSSDVDADSVSKSVDIPKSRKTVRDKPHIAVRAPSVSKFRKKK